MQSNSAGAANVMHKLPSQPLAFAHGSCATAAVHHLPSWWAAVRHQGSAAFVQHAASAVPHQLLFSSLTQQPSQLCSTPPCSSALLQFGTKTARHLFCKTCGVCSYYIPRSNPDGAAVTVHCIDPGTVASVTVRAYDGQNWEQSCAATGIQAASKPVGVGS
jgi:hypothetical protein